MTELLEKHIKDTGKFDRNRIFWLKLSAFVALYVLLTALDWIFLGINNFYWIICSIGFLISLVWWYWTMKMVRELLDHRLTEISILKDVIDDIKEIKNDVKKINNN